MKGQILVFNQEKQNGVIITADEQRFNFAASEWQDDTPPVRGTAVDFESGPGSEARNVYRALAAASAPQAGYSFAQQPKHKPTLILLAIFLGTLGAHKFYMGAWGWGIVYIVATLLFAGILTIPVAIVEWVRYILANDAEFDAKVRAYQARNPGPFAFYW